MILKSKTTIATVDKFTASIPLIPDQSLFYCQNATKHHSSLERDVAVLLRERLGRFAAQNLQILANDFSRHRRVNYVIDETTSRGHLRQASTQSKHAEQVKQSKFQQAGPE